MPRVTLSGCTATPFGSYLKALGVLRLVSDQADREARGFWDQDTFVVESSLAEDDLAAFFIEKYQPTPILAPWNGGSGFYPKDNHEGVDAILASTDERFAAYRKDILICQSIGEVVQGKGSDAVQIRGREEEERRCAILRHCRNRLSDRAVEWLDATVGIAADGSRAFAPVVGTGGNEGRLDYTNNFMTRVASLLISPSAKTPVRELLANALFGRRTTALQSSAAGQFDPGRAGGANQGSGIEQDAITNPWDLVLTLEGAVAWASGIYRRQGAGYRSILCSPFTVRARAVGYGSASAKDDARAEIWTPLWHRPVRYDELKTLLREGRASVQGRPAANALEFAEAARSLGVDRGIERFVRYSLLKRRGDSYVALPVGTFPTGYRSETDRIREFQLTLDALDRRGVLTGMEELRRNVDSAIYQVLLTGGKERMRELMAALGRMLRRVATTTERGLPFPILGAQSWLRECGFDVPEVRIAAALASVWSPQAGSMGDNLSRGNKQFAWTGRDLCERLRSILTRRIQTADAAEAGANPTGGNCAIHPGDATLFIEGSVDDGFIEELLFAFAILDWTGFAAPGYRTAEVLPAYAVLKHLFLPVEVRIDGSEPKRLRADPRILTLLAAEKIEDSTAIAVRRLRVAGFRPLDVTYEGGVDARRLAAALLIPVWSGKVLASGIFHEQEHPIESYA